MRKDLQFALRQLLRSPGFTLIAIVTLGLGIGANTSMFSLLNTLMFRPLPYADSAGLSIIYRATAQDPDGRISAADFLDLQRQAPRYGELAAYAISTATVSEPGQPAEMASGIRVTDNFFSTLGIQPQLGRDFRRGEDVAGNDRIVILSQRSWQNRFGGRADIVGRTVRVDGEPHEIVGVLPAAFNDWRHLGSIDLFRPLGLNQQAQADRRTALLRVIGRRSAARPGAEAAGFIVNVGSRLAADFPDVNAGSTWRSVALNAAVIGGNGATMVAMLVGLSGFVLLIACSNLANFLLARTMARAREFAVRSALGATRMQLLRPLLAESLLLALAGGVCAVFVARWAGDYLAMRSTGDNGEQVLFALDWRVLSWALGASLATVLAFALAPALFAMRIDLNGTLKSGARGTTGGRGHQRFRHTLIVGQFALAMVLLAGAALFIRGVDTLNQRRAGWESEQLVGGTILLPAAAYPDADRITAFHRLAIGRLQSLPGVASVSLSSFTPFFDWPDTRKYVVEGRQLPERGREPTAVVNSVSPRYFDTVGTRLIAGRVFDERDRLSSPRVLVISQSMAKGLFGDAAPLGRRVAQAGTAAAEWGEIVGVVADVKSVVPDAAVVTYQVYQPVAQEPRARAEIAVRAAAGVAPASLVSGIRAAITNLDPDLPIRKLQPADAIIERANYQLRVLRDMLSAFAVLGLALASLGVYGVIARTMRQRTSEFAIRLALGAGVRDITRMVLGSGVKLAAAGCGLGVIGALGISRLLGAAWPGMQFDNLPVMTAATAFLVAVALVACYLPARKASRISAVDALRLD
jgi:putative ABC transport system permease protein